MSTAAIAARHIDTNRPSRTVTCASHAQTAATRPEIRVIAGGLHPNRKQALHARSRHGIAEHELSNERIDRHGTVQHEAATKPRLFQGMQGVSYSLSSGERVMTAGAGILFTLAAIAAMTF